MSKSLAAFGAGLLIIIAAIFALATCVPFGAWAQEIDKKEEYRILNEWRKEIVRLQYTDFCGAVKPMSPQAMQVLQQVIKQGEEAKHPVATELKQWLEGIAEKYAERGCGDA